MPPKAKPETKPAGSKPSASRETCEHCGEKGSTRPYNASTGQVLHLCDECYGYGTDPEYSPSHSGSSDDDSDGVKSESEAPETDDDSDV